MYILPSITFDASTSTSYYTSLAGRYSGQQTVMGIEANSTPLRGMLQAILLGLEKISHQHGVQLRHKVDILITDPELRRQVESKTWPSVLASDADDLWLVLAKWKQAFKIRYVSSPAQSEHMKTIFAWSSVPPAPAELPAGY